MLFHTATKMQYLIAAAGPPDCPHTVDRDPEGLFAAFGLDPSEPDALQALTVRVRLSDDAALTEDQWAAFRAGAPHAARPAAVHPRERVGVRSGPAPQRSRRVDRPVRRPRVAAETQDGKPEPRRLLPRPGGAVRQLQHRPH